MLAGRARGAHRTPATLRRCWRTRWRWRSRSVPACLSCRGWCSPPACAAGIPPSGAAAPSALCGTESPPSSAYRSPSSWSCWFTAEPRTCRLNASTWAAPRGLHYGGQPLMSTLFRSSWGFFSRFLLPAGSPPPPACQSPRHQQKHLILTPNIIGITTFGKTCSKNVLRHNNLFLLTFVNVTHFLLPPLTLRKILFSHKKGYYTPQFVNIINILIFKLSISEARFFGCKTLFKQCKKQIGRNV